MIYFISALIAIIPIFLLVILIRTFNFKPIDIPNQILGEISFDSYKAVEDLRKLIRCKTVSFADSSLEDNQEFQKLLDLLPEIYPNVFRVCDYKTFPERAILFKWSGKNHNEPAVLMAHYDVVPVNEDGWEKPPFDAVLEDGCIWGRGTLDTKATFSSILFSANHLIANGFVPENDIYLAFSGSEEINGKGAENIVRFFEENGIIPSMVLDEGGAVVENVFPGVTKPCGLIGIAEKGIMNVEFSSKSQGGHASAPKPHTPVGKVSSACVKIENKPFKAHLTKPVSLMFDTLGRHSTFLYRMIFANMWAFGWIIDIICKKNGGELNALMRTTLAFTQMSGSSAPNVIPHNASMVANIRLNPHDNIDSALEYIKSAVNDRDIEIKLIKGMNPSRISRTDCKGYELVNKAIEATWKDTIVSPYLMVQCSDSRHYSRISDKVYRFSAMDLTSKERASIHGNNEKIRIEALKKTTEFFLRLINEL